MQQQSAANAAAAAASRQHFADLSMQVSVILPHLLGIIRYSQVPIKQVGPNKRVGWIF